MGKTSQFPYECIYVSILYYVLDCNIIPICQYASINLPWKILKQTKLKSILRNKFLIHLKSFHHFRKFVTLIRPFCCTAKALIASKHVMHYYLKTPDFQCYAIFILKPFDLFVLMLLFFFPPLLKILSWPTTEVRNVKSQTFSPATPWPMKLDRSRLFVAKWTSLIGILRQLISSVIDGKLSNVVQ